VRRLVERVAAHLEAPDPASAPAPPRAELAAAVRATVAVLATEAPGHAVEVRVPPFAAVQCVDGPRHTRGTPPNVVETDPLTWLRLATGVTTWDEARAAGAVQASGTRAAEVAALLPVVRLRPGGPGPG